MMLKPVSPATTLMNLAAQLPPPAAPTVNVPDYSQDIQALMERLGMLTAAQQRRSGDPWYRAPANTGAQQLWEQIQRMLEAQRAAQANAASQTSAYNRYMQLANFMQQNQGIPRYVPGNPMSARS